MARARARRKRRVALIGLLIGLAALAAVIIEASRGEDSHAVATKSVQLQRSEIVGTTIVRGPKANEAGGVGRSNAPRAESAGGLPSLQGKTIAIDPGHNGMNYAHTAEINRLVDAGTLRKACDTTGTETADGYTEAAYTLDVSLRLAALLRRAGARVVMTRTTNTGWGPCITERAAIGNRAHAQAAISIHADGGPPTGRGFHVIYPPAIKGLTDDIASASYRLALDIRRSYNQRTGMPYATYLGHQGLDQRSDLGGLNLSNVPKVLIETGNMRNTTDAGLLKTAAFRQNAAEGLARGLAAFLGGR
jgi:N-acetylmuramoyl-L-alanine amidase